METISVLIGQVRLQKGVELRIPYHNASSVNVIKVGSLSRCYVRIGRDAFFLTAEESGEWMYIATEENVNMFTKQEKK